jgi:hypothetical protein
METLTVVEYVSFLKYKVHQRNYMTKCHSAVGSVSA